ncbi:MAG: ATP-dependent RNA helicase RhlE [Candidatus Azotimanducaceae bacterium]|jgi:ATP-dependent RNA helicase RhlE
MRALCTEGRAMLVASNLVSPKIISTFLLHCLDLTPVNSGGKQRTGASSMSFDSLGLSAEILNAVSDSGYTEPTPVQQEAIPLILEGRDLMAGAQTGTGKTAGFTLPILEKLLAGKSDKQNRPVRALIVVPTRELAAQVHESVVTYGRHLPLSSTVVFGGVNIRPQIAKLRRGVDILIATPGRLLDHVNQGNVNLGEVEILVLDEADRMLDMGFIPDVKRIMKLIPDNRQTLLFSATFSKEIKVLANTFLRDPAQVQIAQQNTTAERIAQVVHLVDQKQKRELLSHMIGEGDWNQVLIFTRTKHGANRLATQLEKDGIKSAAIHGNKSQGARTRALADFKQGKVRALVATDIAARGLDIDQLPHVVNFELPHKPEDYVHRIGRTGRAGHEGEALSLVCREETKLLRDIERLLDKKLTQKTTEGYEPTEPALSKDSESRIPTGSSRSRSSGGSSNRSSGSSSNRSSGSSSNRSSNRSRSSSSGRSGNGSSNRSSSDSGNRFGNSTGNGSGDSAGNSTGNRSSSGSDSRSGNNASDRSGNNSGTVSDSRPDNYGNREGGNQSTSNPYGGNLSSGSRGNASGGARRSGGPRANAR